jgi:hypothetical protein
MSEQEVLSECEPLLDITWRLVSLEQEMLVDVKVLETADQVSAVWHTKAGGVSALETSTKLSQLDLEDVIEVQRQGGMSVLGAIASLHRLEVLDAVSEDVAAWNEIGMQRDIAVVDIVEKVSGSGIHGLSRKRGFQALESNEQPHH